jgi:hypothetical protein
MVIRGAVIESDLVEFQGRGGALTFLAPDPLKYVDRIPLASPAQLADLYELSFDDILDYLEELGQALDIKTNEHMQLAREFTYAAAERTRPLVDNDFKVMGGVFKREFVRDLAERTIGLDYLNGWVEETLPDGTSNSIRAFGARTLHIIAGNSAGGAAISIVRNAFLRSDCIIKLPSNNPFAGIGIGRTMCEIEPDHPITKHVAIAYWRGGDEAFEQRLYLPHNVEKIIAWGGMSGVKHVTRYIQPGLELISLDPKSSASVVDATALSSDAELREVALRIAVDVGAGNQTACTAARVIYVVTGGTPVGLERLNRLGEWVYEELIGLPGTMSTKPKFYDSELRSHIDSLRLQDEWYTVIGGEDDEGCIIVSQLSEPVDFAGYLANRTANLVPVDSLADVLPRFDAYTQTVGVYPEALKETLLDIAPLFGVQRFVSLGFASYPMFAPWDGIELDRRMVKWVINTRNKTFPVTFAADRAGEVPPDSDAVTPGTLEAVRAH